MTLNGGSLSRSVTMPTSRQPLMAQLGCSGRGGAVPLRPDSSDINLFRYGESVIDLNAQVAHRTFDFLVPQHKLNRPQVASPAVNEGRFRSAQ